MYMAFRYCPLCSVIITFSFQINILCFWFMSSRVFLWVLLSLKLDCWV
jgi:hypothetical protein